MKPLSLRVAPSVAAAIALSACGASSYHASGPAPSPTGPVYPSSGAVTHALNSLDDPAGLSTATVTGWATAFCSVAPGVTVSRLTALMGTPSSKDNTLINWIADETTYTAFTYGGTVTSMLWANIGSLPQATCASYR